MLADAPVSVGGLARLSTCDWPGRLVATVFCQGCPWSCGYCHNPGLIAPRSRTPVPWSVVLSLLQRRRGLLDAVVFSGGEPTFQPGLRDAVLAVRQLGFAVGLHTSGAHPSRLASVLPMTDWVALDIKAPASRYEAVTGSATSAGRAFESLRLVLASGVDHEVRTTVDPEFLDRAALTTLVEELTSAGVRSFAAQRMLRRDPGTGASVALPEPPAEFLAACAARFPTFAYRSEAPGEQYRRNA
ncbi:MAG: anaerobic ribonucleoside-triphosphate reductase activating protein [Micromonosporaceae bacterium]|nr:anaerobic ribonucleoside-triphosphate reductase activating protein [Micromonosporaceae bacterium]